MSTDAEALGGTRVRYTLVMKNDDEGDDWLTWSMDVPWWLSDKAPGSPRAFAVALRDAVRREGFDVHLTASTTLIDEVP